MSSTSTHPADAPLRCAIFLPNFGPFGDVDALVGLATEAEAHGWDGFFIWDHLLIDPEGGYDVADPWVALAAIACATSSIKIGPLVTPLPRRRPWKVARETVTLDRLSGGRLIFGAGLGAPVEPEFGRFGEPTDDRERADRLDEGLEILDGLWSGETFSFSGAHHSLGPVRFAPRPAQLPRPPVWIAGWWPNRRPFRRAARWDGVFPELVGSQTPSPAELREIVAYVESHRDGRGPFDVVVNGVTADDPAAAGRQLAPYRDAGMNWWLERIDSGQRFSVDEVRARITAGPPAL
jgi:alkanesulfonate monooxygenase SsuD/methylene tetrahydromethanopterin reductase-like flavin-dependent oxidoreductase (luciferase family)